MNAPVTVVRAAPPNASPPPLNGSVLVLIQFDVCEEIRFDRLAEQANARTEEQPKVKHSVPAYVRYQRPPVVQPLEPVLLPSGERLEGQIKYFDYGVVSAMVQIAFSGDWQGLVNLAGRWVWDMDFAAHVEPIVRRQLERNAAALVKPYPRWLSEDFLIFHVRTGDEALLAADLTRDHGIEIAQIVRGDRQRLSSGECAEVLQSRISYYESDLAVIGWNAAFLYDTSAGVETAIQLLEYANSQLLEFRHYDDLLSGILGNVYNTCSRRREAPWRDGAWRVQPHGCAQFCSISPSSRSAPTIPSNSLATCSPRAFTGWHRPRSVCPITRIWWRGN